MERPGLKGLYDGWKGDGRLPSWPSPGRQLATIIRGAIAGSQAPVGWPLKPQARKAECAAGSACAPRMENRHGRDGHAHPTGLDGRVVYVCVRLGEVTRRHLGDWSHVGCLPFIPSLSFSCPLLVPPARSAGSISPCLCGHRCRCTGCAVEARRLGRLEPYRTCGSEREAHESWASARQLGTERKGQALLI